MEVACWITHVEIGTLVDGRDVHDLGAENLFNFPNKQVNIPNSTHGAIATTDHGKQLLAIEGTTIGHIRPVVAVVHDNKMRVKLEMIVLGKTTLEMNSRNASSEKLLEFLKDVEIIT